MPNPGGQSGLRRSVVVLVCVLVGSAAAAWAEDGPRTPFLVEVGKPVHLDLAPPRPRHVAGATGRFAEQIGSQMDTLSTLSATVEPGRQLQDHLLYRGLSDSVQSDIRRVYRRAARDYLLEVTAIDALLEHLKQQGLTTFFGGGRSAGAANGGAGLTSGRRSLGFGFGISHLQPEVEIDYGVGRGIFRLSVDTGGSVGMRFRHPRFGGNQVGLGYDGRDTFYVNWNVGGF